MFFIKIGLYIYLMFLFLRGIGCHISTWGIQNNLQKNLQLHSGVTISFTPTLQTILINLIKHPIPKL